MKFLVLTTLILALVCSSYAAELLHADSPDVIPNEYIVVLKEQLDNLDKAVHILNLKESILASPAAQIREEVSGEFGIGDFKGFFATLSADKLKDQLASNNVKYIETNKVVRLNYELESVNTNGEQLLGGTQTGATWGISRISERVRTGSTTYRYNTTTNPLADCWIVDTGILTTHVDFGGRAVMSFNAITGESGQDLNGHGTHVAGTVAGTTWGVHKTCPLFAVKVLNAQGSGTNAGVVAGINHVHNSKRAGRRCVANMSLGGGASTATDNAVNAAVTGGCCFAVAAGNDNANACNYSPARAAQAVGVGATASTDAKASFSNFGTCLKTFAPGQSITSAWIGSNSATSTISGTSMASPHVCGVLALHREVGDFTCAALTTWITETATKNVVTSPGTGSPNNMLYSPYV